MKRHTAASILHPEALVQLFVQVYDIIQYIRENKNTLQTIWPPFLNNQTILYG